MAKLEDIKPNCSVRGVLPNALVAVVSVQWFGTGAIELTYKDAIGKVGNELLYRDREADLEIVEQGRSWSFDGDGALFRLVSEAQCIHLAHPFDPVLAVHIGRGVAAAPDYRRVRKHAPAPADALSACGRSWRGQDHHGGASDQGVDRARRSAACLVVCQGSLAAQWQNELYRRFNLPFEILTGD